MHCGLKTQTLALSPRQKPGKVQKEVLSSTSPSAFRRLCKVQAVNHGACWWATPFAGGQRSGAVCLPPGSLLSRPWGAAPQGLPCSNSLRAEYEL